MNNNYYLTEMNTVKLENCLLKFILNQHLEHLLINGVTSKVISMMYVNGIDYYYSDLLASSVNVPIKLVDNIYCNNQSKYYEDSLAKLLGSVNSGVTPEEAEKFEEDINSILNTKKKIHTTKTSRFTPKTVP